MISRRTRDGCAPTRTGRAGMQIGSGQIESSCKQMVVTRFKRSGCKWSVQGANALMALKSCWKNLQWEEFAFWKAQRIAAG